MNRITLIFFAFFYVSTAIAQGLTDASTQDMIAATALKRGLQSAKREDWSAAFAQVRPAGQLGADIIEWHRLRAGAGTLKDTQTFLSRNPDWPGLPFLRQNSEQTIDQNTPPLDVIAFFKPQAPRTLIGSLRLAQGLMQTGQIAQAHNEIARTWVQFEADADTEQKVLATFDTFLAAHHEARLKMRLWAKDHDAVRRLLPLVSRPIQQWAQARIALQKFQNDAPQLAAQLPPDFINDAGLAFDFFRWELRKGDREHAIAKLIDASRLKETLDRPDLWATDRLRLVRDLMWEKRHRLAYDVARRHHLSDGRTYAELEWLAGYIALRQLDLPQDALRHFENHQRAVGTPISLSRSHYWQGRAYEVLNAPQNAQASYRAGAAYQTAFYGLLSAEKISRPLDSRLRGNEKFTPSTQALFLRSSVYHAGRLFLLADHPRLGARFLTHLAESLDREELGQLAALAENADLPNIELLLAKRGLQYGNMIERHFYPLHDLKQHAHNVPPEMALAIARRESEFFADARSSVGALGLMQLMPPTAREMAQTIGLPWKKRQLTQDWRYNARLGTAYLSALEQMYGRSPVQIAAAYNAGPSRADFWLNYLGDPRQGEIDIIDWIEHIPFSETRNYVMRVAESLPNYRARLGRPPLRVSFTQELTGTYVPPEPFDDSEFEPFSVIRPVARE